MRRIIRFLKETRAELAKVVWPTRMRALRLSIIVVIVTAIYGVFIAGVDFGLSKGIQYVIDTTQQKGSPAPEAGQPPVEVPGGVPGQPGQPVPQGAQPGQPLQVPPGQPNQPSQ